MRGTLLHRRTQHAHDARRRSSNIWNDLDQLREERRQSKPAPQTRKELLQEKLRAHALACCESTRFTAGMTILTLHALFGDDAKLCLADSTADAAFVYAAVVCIFCFFAEMLLQCLAYPWYFRGFYFWVDLASTLSILTEIPSVMEEVAILVGGSGGQEAEMLKAGKAGRVGTKATKIIRIVRLVRISGGREQERGRRVLGLVASSGSKPPMFGARPRGQSIARASAASVLTHAAVPLYQRPRPGTGAALRRAGRRCGAEFTTIRSSGAGAVRDESLRESVRRVARCSAQLRLECNGQASRAIVPQATTRVPCYCILRRSYTRFKQNPCLGVELALIRCLANPSIRKPGQTLHHKTPL